MNQTGWILCVAMAVAALAAGGCADTLEAHELIKPNTAPGRIVEFLLDPVGLVRDKHIDAHREIMSPDGLKLDVWIIHNKRVLPGGAKARATVVLLHPMVMSKSWFLSTGQLLAAEGYDVVMPDARAHGRSEGELITWGAKERHDVKTIVDRVLAETLVSEPLYVAGASMGACTAIQYAAIDPRCKGVLAIAPPAGIRGIANIVKPAFSSSEDIESAITAAGELGTFDPDNASPAAAAARLKCPLILAHGLLDVIVPYDQGRSVYEAAPEPKQFITRPLSTHGSEFGNETWVLKQVNALVEMSQER